MQTDLNNIQGKQGFIGYLIKMVSWYSAFHVNENLLTLLIFSIFFQIIIWEIYTFELNFISHISKISGWY